MPQEKRPGMTMDELREINLQYKRDHMGEPASDAPQVRKFVSELMRRATSPLLPQIGEGWDQIANLIDDPNGGSSNVPLETVKGGLAGIAHGVGKVASDATSPLGLIAMLAGGGAGRGLSNLGKASQSAKYAEAAKGLKPNLPPEFTPVGDEPQRLATMFMDPVEAAYGRLLARGGR